MREGERTEAISGVKRRSESTGEGETSRVGAEGEEEVAAVLGDNGRRARHGRLEREKRREKRSLKRWRKKIRGEERERGAGGHI